MYKLKDVPQNAQKAIYGTERAYRLLNKSNKGLARRM